MLLEHIEVGDDELSSESRISENSVAISTHKKNKKTVVERIYIVYFCVLMIGHRGRLY